ncbi:MAG: mannose-1-phosphate guanylyltransferase [Lachnospiraceae bacterium]|nr:mannose-1-phosphate guanylyltransferase [Lachnospiraceae bacterium]
MKTYGVIMAGGGGTRFWPLSTKAEPKQFLNLSGKDILVNETIDRQSAFIDKEDIFIVTNQSQAELMLQKTEGRIRADHILAEPAARNTAACIGYAAMEITKKYSDGVMCIFAADHHIRDEKEYTRIMKEAVRIVEETDALVTVGIHPTFPSTGYGYIKNSAVKGKTYHKVDEFVEKPDADTAMSYVAAGTYAWNSGMFVWKASTILRYFKELLPDIYACLTQIGDAMGTDAEKEVIRKVYPVIPKISVDYGIMERAKGVLMLEGDFGWSDVGSWDTLDSVRTKDENGNISSGDTLLLDTENCVVYGKHKLIATVGVKDLVVVEADNAVLVCPVRDAQRVKQIVETLEKNGGESWL